MVVTILIILGDMNLRFMDAILQMINFSPTLERSHDVNKLFDLAGRVGKSYIKPDKNYPSKTSQPAQPFQSISM